MKQLQQNQLTYTLKWIFKKIYHSMSVNSNPTTSQKIMNKFPVSKFFSIIASVVEIGD
jgi:hypothetical protein